MLSFLKKYKNYIQNSLVVLLTVLLILSIKQCSENKNWKNQYEKNYEQKKDSFESVVSNKNIQIALQEEKIIQRNESAEQLADSIKQLKQVNRQIKLKTKGKVYNDTITIDSPVYISNCDSGKLDSSKYLKVPARFRLNKKWYNIKGKISDTGLINLKKLIWLSEPTITVGVEKKSFLKDLFGKNDIKITYKDNNPYTRVQSMDNIKVKDELKKNKKFGIGPIVGYGFVGSKTGWIIGLGGSYHLIKF